MAKIHIESIYSGGFNLTDVINLSNFLRHMSNYDQPEWEAICGYIRQEIGINFEELCEDIEQVVDFMTDHLV